MAASAIISLQCLSRHRLFIHRGFKDASKRLTVISWTIFSAFLIMRNGFSPLLRVVGNVFLLPETSVIIIKIQISKSFEQT